MGLKKYMFIGYYSLAFFGDIKTFYFIWLYRVNDCGTKVYVWYSWMWEIVFISLIDYNILITISLWIMISIVPDSFKWILTFGLLVVERKSIVQIWLNLYIINETKFSFEFINEHFFTSKKIKINEHF